MAAIIGAPAGLQPAPLPGPGIHQLYLPHLLFRVRGHGPNQLTTPIPHDWSKFSKPVANAQWQPSLIPFTPIGYRKLPDETRLHPLLRVESSTSEKSFTKTADTVQSLGQDKRLVTLRKCDDLAEHLRLYANPQSGGVQSKTEAGRHFLARLFGNHPPNGQRQHVLYTDGPQSLEYPDAQEQYESILRLSAWFQLHASENTFHLVSSGKKRIAW